MLAPETAALSAAGGLEPCAPAKDGCKPGPAQPGAPVQGAEAAACPPAADSYASDSDGGDLYLSDGSAWSEPGTIELRADPALLVIRQLLSQETLHPDFICATQRDGRGGVTAVARAEMLGWLADFNAFFGLEPTTFGIASVLVDKVLALTRVKPEHIEILGVACLLIAAKRAEPVDLQPTLRELSINCNAAFSEAAIRRMESIVLQKLGPELSTVTPCAFLGAFLDHAVSQRALDPAEAQLAQPGLVNKLLTCTLQYELLAYRTPTLALAVLRSELGAAPGTAFADFVRRLCQLMDCDEAELAGCEERVGTLLAEAAEAGNA